MSYYQIRCGGRPVALVETIDVAQKIVRRLRAGPYLIETVESEAKLPSGVDRHLKSSAAKPRLKSRSDLKKARAGKSPRKVTRRKPGDSR